MIRGNRTELPLRVKYALTPDKVRDRESDDSERILHIDSKGLGEAEPRKTGGNRIGEYVENDAEEDSERPKS